MGGVFEHERRAEASLIAALGLDPATVVVGIETVGPRRVRMTRLIDGARRVEEHEVPDGWSPPGTPEPTTVGDLRMSQVGRRIRITTEGTTIEGPLRALRVEQDWIEVTGATDSGPVRVPGRQTVTIDVGRWSCSSLAPTTPAWWLDTPS